VLSHRPIFFQITVDSKVYKGIITQLMSILEENECHCWLQKMASHAILLAKAMDFLKDYFDNHLISKGLCSSRTSDLPPTDFFFWSHLKGQVYSTNPYTLEELKGQHRNSNGSNYRCSATYGVYKYHKEGLSLHWYRRRSL
jgi:hypothetical protein